MHCRRHQLLFFFFLLIISCGKTTRIENSNREYLVQLQEDERDVGEDGKERPSPDNDNYIEKRILVEEELSQIFMEVHQAVYADIIVKLGGNYIPSNGHPYTEDGFDQYLADSGVRYFSAKELSKIGGPNFARECGITSLMPPRIYWERTVMLALFADKIRMFLGIPIKVTSHWRPKCYNQKVKGVVGSYHIGALAMDLDLGSEGLRQKVQGYVCDNFIDGDAYRIKSARAGVSFEVGKEYVHIGITSGVVKFFRHSSYFAVRSRSRGIECVQNKVYNI